LADKNELSKVKDKKKKLAMSEENTEDKKESAKEEAAKNI
jgi:hypothetical protein